MFSKEAGFFGHSDTLCRSPQMRQAYPPTEHSRATWPRTPHRWHTSPYFPSAFSLAVFCFMPQNFSTWPLMPHLVHTRGFGQFLARWPVRPQRWHGPS